MKETQELLEQLHDIELPGGSGLSIAPGWLVLLLLLLCVIIFVIWRLLNKREPAVPAPDWRKPAMAELEEIDARLQRGDAAKVLADCSRLARRVTLARLERAEVAGLTGQVWLRKLDHLSASDFFTKGRGQLLATAPYQKNATTNPAQLQQIIHALQDLIGQQDQVRV